MLPLFMDTYFAGRPRERGKELASSSCPWRVIPALHTLAKDDSCGRIQARGRSPQGTAIVACRTQARCRKPESARAFRDLISDATSWARTSTSMEQPCKALEAPSPRCSKVRGVTRGREEWPWPIVHDARRGFRPRVPPPTVSPRRIPAPRPPQLSAPVAGPHRGPRHPSSA
jgi:hypothetical protein